MFWRLSQGPWGIGWQQGQAAPWSSSGSVLISICLGQLPLLFTEPQAVPSLHTLPPVFLGIVQDTWPEPSVCQREH